MAKSEHSDGPLEREYLRDALRRQGKDGIDDVADAIQRRWHHSPLRSYRLAKDLSLEEVCRQVNKILDTFVGDAGYFRHPVLSRYEYWPAPQSRRPTVSHLLALAEVYGTSPRRLISDADWDKLPPADRYTLRALDHGSAATTATAGTPGMMESTRPQAGSAPHDPPNWWAAPEPIGSGNPIERAVTMANDESARYADRAANVGPATLDALRTDTAAQASRFANTNRLELFASVRLLRDRIFGYLDGGQPIQQRRDLYFLAAAACGLLAMASDDLGYAAAGMSQAQVAHVFAMEAGEPALTAWLYVMQANICYWNGQPGKAREYARRGTALSPAGTVGVWLPAMEARAASALGDVEGARLAVQRAGEVRGTVQPSTVDGFGGLMHYNQAKQHFYGATTFLGIGDDEAALGQASAAVETYRDGPPEEYNYTDVVITHFDAAIAHVRSSNLDAAVDSAGKAFQIGTEHRNVHVDKSARRLHHHLSAPGIQNAPLAIEARDQIEEFLSIAQPRLELS